MKVKKRKREEGCSYERREKVKKRREGREL